MSNRRYRTVLKAFLLLYKGSVRFTKRERSILLSYKFYIHHIG